jgi:hypothetical protein
MLEKLLPLIIIGLSIAIIDKFTPIKKWFHNSFAKNRRAKIFFLITYIIVVTLLIFSSLSKILLISIVWVTVYLWYPTKTKA